MQSLSDVRWPRAALRLSILIGFMLATACGGCGDDPIDGKEDGEPAALTISPTMQGFGTVQVGETSETATFTVENDGGRDSTPIDVAITGSAATEFTIVDDACSGETLGSGDTCDIDVEFTPLEEVLREAVLEVSASDGGDIAAALSGSGTTAGGAVFSISPTPNDFGEVLVGEMSEPADFTVTNTSGSESGVLTSNLNAGDAGDFAVTADGCTGGTLTPEESCVITALFSPGSSGEKSTDLRVIGGPEDGEAIAALSGTGVTDAELTITPATQDFGSVSVSTTSNDVTFTVSNSGDIDSGELATVLSGADASEFVVVSDECTATTLSGGGECSIVVHFAPASIGVKAATLDVSSATGDAVSAELSGTAETVGGLVVAPSPYDFGSVLVGETSTSTTFTVQNSGLDSGVLNTTIDGANPGDFDIDTVSDNCQGQQLASGETCTVEVTFTPTVAGPRTATLSISAAASNDVTVALAGVGESPALLEIAPTAQSFGSVAVGQTSTPVTFTVTNTGTQTSGDPTPVLGGANADQFAIVVDGCTAPLGNNEACTVDVEFAPTLIGDKIASLDVAATPGGTVTADLTGTGSAPASLSPSTTTLTFGDVVNGGASNTQTITVTNNGAQATGALTAQLTAGEYTITDDGCSGVVLDAGETCTITLEFSPTTIGASVGELTVSAAPGSMLTIGLSGNSLPEFAITPDNPDPYDFGDHTIGDANPPSQVFTVTNTAEVGSVSRDLTAALGATTSFTVIANTCDGSTVAAGDTCTVEVEFDPTSPPGQKNVTVTVTDENATAYTRDLVGTAISDVPLDITPTDYDFVDVPNGENRTVTFTVTNTTANTVGPLETIFTNSGEPFGLVSDGCSGTTLDAFGGTNDACEITVIFYPTAIGDYGTATLQVDSATESTAVVDIDGNAIDPATLVTLSIDAVAVPATTVATETWQRQFTIRNTGASATGALTVGLSGSAIYSLTTDDCSGNTLAASATCTVIVTTAPGTDDEPVEQIGTLEATASPGGTASRDIATTVLPQLTTVSPTSPHTFDDTVVGGTSAAVTFTVQNESDNVVSSPAVAATGPFTIDSNGCGTIAANGTCTVNVTFEPSAVGDDQPGELTVGSGPSGTATWQLEGSAGADAQLAWAPATTDFGLAEVGDPGLIRTFVLRNDGGLATATSPIFTFDPVVDAQFTVDTSDCGAALPAGGTCDVVATFEPDAVGTTTLDITAEADNQAGSTLSDTISLTAEAVAASSFTIDPMTVQFADMPAAGETSTEQATFTVSNNTGAAVNNLTIQLSNGEFSLVAGQDDCSGQNLADGQSCTFDVEFTPGTAGDKSATITVRRGGTRTTAVVFGTAATAAALEFTDGDPDFGPVVVNVGATETFTVTNVGDQTIGSITSSISGLSVGQYDIVADDCAGGLAGGESCELDVEFLPTSLSTDFPATLAVTPDVGAGASVDLSGAGVTGAELELSPTTAQDCGDEVAAEGSVDCPTFTLANTGGVGSDDFDISLTTGTDFEIVSTNCAETDATPAFAGLGGGESCDITVAYTPDDISADDTDTLSVDDGTTVLSTDLSGDSTTALTTPAADTTQPFTAAVGAATSQTFTYTNATGTPPTGPLTVELSGTNAAEFSVAGDCWARSFDGGDSCSVTVTFTPTTVASGRTAALDVGDGTVNKTAPTVDLDGTGTN